MNLELRGRVWYATLLVPPDVRDSLGRVRFKQSLGTSNRREAVLKAAPFIARWKAQISQARGFAGAVSEEVKRWRDALVATDEDSQEMAALLLKDAADQIEERKGFDAAQEFYELSSGLVTPSAQYFDAWKDAIDLIPKTKDQMVKDVGLLIAKFPTLQAITKPAVRRWVDELAADGKGPASIKRVLSFCRHYWRFLHSHAALPEDSAPFTGVIVESKAGKGKAKKTTNLPYSPADVVKLWEAAGKRRIGKAKNAPADTQLADLILLGAHTGARIEELCSVKVDQVTDDTIRIADSKTLAGIREVPIHSHIAALVKRLREESKDGYLLSDLTFNKYEDRSNAIGKRFGRLKAALGFPASHTFHSFRATVATLLENAGVPEGVAADIVGHDKPTMTYGLYSGGADIATKRAALEKVRYPFP